MPFAPEKIFAATRRTFGRDAAYQPPGGGAAVPVRVVVAAPDLDQAFDGPGVTGMTATGLVMAADLPTPEIGGRLTMADDGATFVVSAPPKLDQSRKQWRLPLQDGGMGGGGGGGGGGS